jgi:hypothetical protein
MTFVKGKSYARIFIVFCLAILICMVLIGVRVLRLQYATIVIPMLYGYVLVAQLRSGLALDRYWRAQHERGTWQYNVSLAFLVTGIIGGLAICYIACRYLV